MLTKKIDGVSLVLTTEEEDAVRSEWAENDRPRTAQEIDAIKSAHADIDLNFTPTLKAFAKAMLSEINVLRINAGLPAITGQELKNKIKAKL